MTPVDQDEVHVPGVSHGNCYAAALASLMDRPLEDLRTFHELYCAYFESAREGKHDFAKREAYCQELHRLGWHAVHFANPKQGNDVDIGRAAYGCVPAGYAIASGPSPRGVDHSVVVLDGQLAHDPHPSREGLLSIESFEVLIRVACP